MKTGDELIEYFSSFHENSLIPDVLLIDDLHHYISKLQVIISTLIIVEYYQWLFMRQHNI